MRNVAGTSTQLTGKRVFADNGVLLSETRYLWNAQGRMSRVDSDPDGEYGYLPFATVVTYNYDDRGVRVQKAEGDNTTRYLVDFLNPTGYPQVLQAVTKAGVSFVSAVAYTLGLDIVSEASYPLTASPGTSVHLIYDGHGSTRALVAPNGAIVTSPTRQLFAYDAYGNMLSGYHFTSPNNAGTELLYSGERTDKATGLQYLGTNGGRYYSAATGTFTTMDSFAGNFSDPLRACLQMNFALAKRRDIRLIMAA